MEIPQNTINMGLMAPAAGRCLQDLESKCEQTCSRAWDGLGFGGWWSDHSCPQALPALAFQALGQGARGVWVQLCYQGGLENLARKHYGGPHLCRSFQPRGQWELLPCM